MTEGKNKISMREREREGNECVRVSFEERLDYRGKEKLWLFFFALLSRCSKRRHFSGWFLLYEKHEWLLETCWLFGGF